MTNFAAAFSAIQRITCRSCTVRSSCGTALGGSCRRLFAALRRGLGWMATAPLLSLLATQALCATAPTPLATGLNTPYPVAVDVAADGFVYWGELSGSTATLRRIKSLGGPPESLASFTAFLDPYNTYRGIERIVFTADKLYFGWGSYDGEWVEEVTRTGGPRRIVVDKFTGGSLLGVINGYVYYSYGFCCIAKVPIDRSTGPQTVLTGNWVRNNTYDSDAIYFTEYNTRNVYRFDLTTNALTPLITGNAVEGGITIDAKNLYYSSGTKILSVPKLGGTTSPPLYTGTNLQVRVSDGGLLYFTESNVLKSLPIDGRAPSLILTGTSVVGMVQDTNFLYWADTSAGVASGVLQRLRKVWKWPIRDFDIRRPFAQDYAEYGAYVNKKHHTGIDIAMPHDTAVIAAAAGAVITLQKNDIRATNLTCVKSDSNCADHGFGNTIILRHVGLDGIPVYSQYSHLQPFDIDNLLYTQVTTTTGCTASNDGLTYSCSPNSSGIYPVLIASGQNVGAVGRTGFGKTPYGFHLHFEIKYFPTLNTARDIPGPGFGYTGLHPDSVGYVDPISYIEGISSPNGLVLPEPRVVVQTTAAGSLIQNNFLRAGPRVDYNCYIEHSTNDSADLGRDLTICNRNVASGIFIATHTSEATLGCDAGWYQVARINRDVATSFDRTGDTSGYFSKRVLSQDGMLPEAWICLGNAGVVWARLFRTGDVDGDGVANQADLCKVNSEVLKAGRRGRSASGPDDPFDLNGDGLVDSADVSLLGRLCSPGCQLNACP